MPPSFLLGLDLWLRVIVAVAIAVLPIFAANVIFAKRFADTADAPLAFGTNLLGAILGGCLEYLSLVFGYRALLVIAAIVYVARLPSSVPARSRQDRSAILRRPVLSNTPADSRAKSSRVRLMRSPVFSPTTDVLRRRT